jgi:hypothetical protein
MNIFKTITLKWWQGSIFKWTMLSAGIAVGATWPNIFSSWTGVFWAMFAVGAVYLTYVWWKQ